MKPTAFLFPILLVFLLSSCKTSIVQTPIIFDQERKELSLEYLENRYGLDQNEATIIPKMVVIHWTAIPTLEKSFAAFYESKLPNFRPEIASASALNVSVQYLIDRDGTIYQLLPDNTFCRHVIGLNHCSIGIENVGNGDTHPLTDAQLKSNIKLIRQLAKKHPIEYVIGHHEYTQFEDHPLWLEKDKGYRTVKYDPGEAFMSKLRPRLKNLNLKELPK
ncbi:MAG: N-acetylmuramoyl-L-alanine amidase [Saprospiraceae bacterium]|nr:N-acetylmuramoyl-L-alanine amidase [Saprospiraceae bacterium]